MVLFTVVTNLHSRQVNLSPFSTRVNSGLWFERSDMVMLSCNNASEIELFLVECLSGFCSIDDDELKLREWSVHLCFFKVVNVLAVKSHILHGNVEPPLYLTVDLFTLLGPRVSITMPLKLAISSW